jgi:hypothetical protein
MTVDELMNQLVTYPGETQVDAMFKVGNDAYFVTGTELLELQGGKQVVIVNLDTQPGLAVA